jgi:AcrR family transcriptional regulator
MARHVITYTRAMSRWEPDARGRLERAAVELFLSRGFADTTVPEIAERAGLTTRTFFRHFADKREVLFGAEAELPGVVSGVLADAPPGLTPLELVEFGLTRVAASRFNGLREFLRARRSIIVTDVGLQERELRKNAGLGDVIRNSLASRGFDSLAASIAARIAVAIFTLSLDRWLDGDDDSFASLVTEAFATTRSIDLPQQPSK